MDALHFLLQSRPAGNLPATHPANAEEDFDMVKTARRLASFALHLATCLAIASAAMAQPTTYIEYDAVWNEEVMIPVESHCASYTGPSDLGTPSLLWASEHEDLTAISTENEDHLFIYPKEGLQFETDEISNATCWYQLPTYLQEESKISITLVGHGPTWHFPVTDTVDFDIRYKLTARDESLGHLHDWSAWAATASGELEVANAGNTDYSSRTDSYTLVSSGAAEGGDVLQWRIRRNGDTDDHDSEFNVDYFILEYTVQRSVKLGR